MRDESNLILDIEFARQLNDQLIKGQASPKSDLDMDLDMDVTTAINNTAIMLKAIISTKTELCRLPLSFCEREYVDNYVTPLVTVLLYLSLISFELSISVSILSFSPIVPPKKSKLKDTIHYGNAQDCHPHPYFTHDSKAVIFSSDMNGKPAVYKVII